MAGHKVDFEDSFDENLVKTASKMKAKGYSVADISDITGLTAEEIEKL